MVVVEPPGFVIVNRTDAPETGLPSATVADIGTFERGA